MGCRLQYEEKQMKPRFVGERIETEISANAPRPLSFIWRGEKHEIAEILSEWVDTSFGQLPSRSRKWYTRRHRRYFLVRDSAGDVFEIYLDYADRKNKTWWLTRQVRCAGGEQPCAGLE